MRMTLILRFDYGAAVPWVTRLHDEPGIMAVAGPDMTVLRTPVPLQGQGLTTVAAFTVAAGETVPFVLTHSASHLTRPPGIDPLAALDRTEAVSGATGPPAAPTAAPTARRSQRSLLTLKALTFRPTGGIVAAPTTSLPEALGGSRNWDYRYCWLRDATLTLLALMGGGYFEEAQAWRDWLRRSVAGSPDQLQIMYGLAGERRLIEWEADWLPGYQGARPVRIGNAAHGQLQLDVFGEVADALYQARAGGLAAGPESWELQRKLIAHLEPAGSSPTRASGRPAAGAATSPTPRSWPGSRSTAPSAAPSGSAWTARSTAGGRCGRRCTPASAPAASTPAATASCRATAPARWMRRCC